MLTIGRAAEADYNAWRRVRNTTFDSYNVDAYAELVAPVLQQFKAEVDGVLRRLAPLLPAES